MIDKSEVENMSAELDIHTSYVQRDYVHGWLLSKLATSPLSDRMVLKGGNCLRKGYFEAARYSRDLDFSCEASLPNEQLSTNLNRICEGVQEATGIEFDLNRTLVQDKARVDSDKKVSEARLYFRDFYGAPNEMVISVRLDVTQFDRRYLPVQSRMLIHPYSDSETCSTLIRCVKLEELLATKMRCLLQRKHIADLYDLIYSVFINKQVEVNRAEILSTFFKITLFGTSPRVAKGLLIDLPLEALSRFWKDYVACPVGSRLEFEQARAAFHAFVDSIIPGEPSRGRHPVFFTSTSRNAILAAADGTTLLKVVYDGVARMVEPYEIAFKVRKDGVAREYFYAYDRTGGRSSGPGLKALVSEKLTTVENTEETFEPRFELEIRKAGGAEIVQRFRGRPGGAGYKTSILGRKPHTRSVRRGIGNSYTVQCTYCNRKFRRSTFSTKLNPHKDKYGNKCPGRYGMIV